MSTGPTGTRHDAPLHNLHIVSGKGGTGKTTIAGALACALATEGRRVLVCEVEGRHALSELFGVSRWEGAEERRLCLTPAGGSVYGLSIDAEDALLEYLDTFYHLGIAGKALDRFGVIDFATSIAPGLRDVLLTGKVYEAVRRGIKNRPNAYDVVILDAPPTGRIAQFLNVHQAVAGLAKVGPIRSQADSIMQMLRSDRTVVHLVTLLEDMPVTETGDAITELIPTRIKVGTVITNMISPKPLPLEQLRKAAKSNLAIKVPGLSVAQNQSLAAEFAQDATRMLAEADCRRRLVKLGLPLVDVELDPAGVDETSLFAIAETLAEQLDAEVGR